MSGPGATGERRKWAATIAALLTSPTIKAAAERAGVSEATVYRWQNDPKFRRLYHRAERGLVAAAVGRVSALFASAVETARKLMEDPTSHPNTRLRAVGIIIDTVFKGREHGETRDRLEELEKLVEDLVREQQQQRADSQADGEGEEGG